MPDRPARWTMQTLPGVDPAIPGRRPGEVACPNCHYVWLGERKKCPACYTRLDQPAEVSA